MAPSELRESIRFDLPSALSSDAQDRANFLQRARAHGEVEQAVRGTRVAKLDGTIRLDVQIDAVPATPRTRPGSAALRACAWSLRVSEHREVRIGLRTKRLGELCVSWDMKTCEHAHGSPFAIAPDATFETHGEHLPADHQEHASTGSAESATPHWTRRQTSEGCHDLTGRAGSVRPCGTREYAPHHA
jgi:hypothetical protein